MTTTFKLGPLQEKWLTELESGKYKQGKGFLRHEDRHCCLGVAAECILGIEAIPSTTGAEFYFDGATETLVHSERLGLRDRTGEVCEQDVRRFCSALRDAGYDGDKWGALTEYNDNGATFAQIAAAIHACPEAVFTEPK